MQKQAHIDEGIENLVPTDEKNNADTTTMSGQQPPPLRESAQIAITYFLSELDGEPPTDLHNMVMAQVEEPLLAAIMTFTDGNQSRAAHVLGLNRGTLRKKLRQYGLLTTGSS